MPDEIKKEDLNQDIGRSDRSVDIWRFFAEITKTILTVVVIAYLIRLFIMQPFVVEGSSMAPRFHTNDYLIVDKISYRLHEPNRGDIIVFRYPNDLSINYVKRVIGLPGETVKIEDGKVFIVNKDNPEGFQLAEDKYLADGVKTLLPSGANKSEFNVPLGQYFVLGDNRPASSDSREWGFLPDSDMIGRVIIQAYPLNKAHLVQGADY